MSSSNEKRPQLDAEATPRPKKVRTTASSASVSLTSSGYSNASSPRKQIRDLELYSSPVLYKKLDETSVPAAARPLFEAVADTLLGHDLLPASKKNEMMEALRERGDGGSKWRYSFKPADAGDDDILPGRMPSIEQADHVLLKAAKCDNMEAEEAAWNQSVHMRMLEAVLEESSGKPVDQFEVTLCTSARPHPMFRPTGSTAKMVDICIYSREGDRTTPLGRSFDNLSRLSPTLTVNHTDFALTKSCPIVISIETKKPEAEGARAKLQLGVWYASQWNFLRWAVHQKLMRQHQSLETELDEQELDDKEQQIVDKLSFLPGLLVQGHLWFLVLVTYSRGETTVLSKKLIGTTEDLMGIYSLAAGLRHILAWERDVYLPWFKEHVLE